MNDTAAIQRAANEGFVEDIAFNEYQRRMYFEDLEEHLHPRTSMKMACDARVRNYLSEKYYLKYLKK
jgi:hypothetical protein